MGFERSIRRVARSGRAALGSCVPLLLCVACGGGKELEVGEAPTPPRSAPSGQGAGARPAARPEQELPRRADRSELAGGLVVELLEHGTGRRAAAAGRRVTLHFSTRLAADDTPVESARTGAVPLAITLGAGEVVRGLDRGLVGARAGDRLTIHIPAAMAYGERGVAGIPPGADLILDVRVLGVD